MGINETLTQIKEVLDNLQTSMTTMQGTLETIAGQLGAPPTPPQHTIDDIYALLETIEGNTDGVEGSLTAISGNTNGIGALLTTIRNNSNVLPDVKEYTGNVQDSLYYGLKNLGLSINSETFNYPDNSYLFETLNWLGRLSGALGLPVEVGNRTALQLLALLLDRPVSGDVTGGLFPSDLCEGYYSSTGMIIVPTGVTQVLESTLWAEFPIPPPVGIEFGSTFNLGLDSDTTELVVLEDDWSNWRFYVASSSSNYGIYIGTNVDLSLRRYPSNVWQNFGTLSDNLSFFVPSSESIKVFMCRGTGSGSSSGGPWGGGSSAGGTWEPQCYEVSSTLVAVSPAYGYSPRQHVVISDLSLISTITWPGGTATTTPPAIHSGNYAGWTVTSLSGRIRIVFGVNGVSINAHVLEQTGDTYVIPTGYNYVLFDDSTGVENQPGTGAFTVQFCAPQ
jgi:hypothetical protein